MTVDRPTDLQQKALAYLASHQVMTLATDGPLGLWAAAVFYVNQAFDPYFLSAGSTRHAQNLSANPWTAATIQEDYHDWPAIKGIQLEGNVFMLAGAEREEAISMYQARYPFVASADPQVAAALSRVNWYRVSTTRLYLIDNSLGLGHRDEIALPGR